MAPSSVSPMAGLNEHSDISRAMDRLLASQNAWRDCPDGAQFRRLWGDLYDLVCTVVYNNGKPLTLRVPISGGSDSMSFVILSNGLVRSERRNVDRDLDRDDVIHEYVLYLKDKYIEDPDFRVSKVSFIYTGLGFRIRSMLRTAGRHLGDVLPEGKILTDVASSPGAPERDPSRELQKLWFHYPNRPDCPAAWRTVKALSLRYCYVALRKWSGALLIDIAREIGKNPSRLTRLKEELQVFPQYASFGDFIPLGDFAGVQVEPDALAQLGLGDPEGRDTLRKLPADCLVWVQCRKVALWAVYSFARGILSQPAVTPTTQWIECKPTADLPAARVQVEVRVPLKQAISVLIRAFCEE